MVRMQRTAQDYVQIEADERNTTNSLRSVLSCIALFCAAGFRGYLLDVVLAAEAMKWQAGASLSYTTYS